MLTAAAIVLALSSVPAAQPENPKLKQLTWERLIPLMPPMKNYLTDLPPDQQGAMDDIDYWRSFPTGAIGPEAAKQRDVAKEDVDAERTTFAAKGVDIDAVYANYIKWLEEVDRRGKQTEPEFDGRQVQLAGYLMPLDFNPNGGREFLLVPYVGACIHVPPPPPNQVVYVKSAKPYKLNAIFDGVMVTGKMKTETSTKDLSFIDGSNNVATGYTIENVSIKPYNYVDNGG